MRRLLAVLACLLFALPARGANPTARALSKALADLAAKAVPSVVLVRVDHKRALAPELQELLQSFGLPRAWHATGQGEATGSGVFVSADGRVLTNAHVVQGAIDVTLVLSDQRRIAARVVGVDPRTDVAILAAEEPGPFPWLKLGDSSKVRVGDVVLAIGNPFEFQSTVTLGIVSATGRRGLDQREIQDYLQTDAAVNPGSSGGPLLDLDGEVIGINTAIFAPRADQNSGISFAIPSNLVKRVVDDLERRGRVPRSWVGLVTASATDVDGDPTLRGAEVERVVPDSPAEKAGLRRGDIVLAVDGEPIPSESALRTLVLVHAVGDTLKFRITRDGQHSTVPVVTGEERDLAVGLQELPADTVFWQGMYLAAPTDDLRARFGVGEARGLLVVRVDPDSAAARLGMKTGDVLLDVAGRTIRDPADVAAARKQAPGGVLVLAIERGGTRTFAVLPR